MKKLLLPLTFWATTYQYSDPTSMSTYPILELQLSTKFIGCSIWGGSDWYYINPFINIPLNNKKWEISIYTSTTKPDVYNPSLSAYILYKF